MHRSLAALVDRFPLPAAWAVPQLHVERLQVSHHLELTLVGLVVSRETGENVTASASGRDRTAFTRAYFELLERTAIVDAEHGRPGEPFRLKTADGEDCGAVEASELFVAPASAHQAYARSNGVAAHVGWVEACRSARLEMIERDRILRSWFFEASPPREIVPRDSGLRDLDGYAFRCFAFDASDDPSSDVAVVGNFLLPDATTTPFCCGFGAGSTADEAHEGAERECLQRFGFLQGEAVPQSSPEIAPTPSFHLEHYLHHGNHGAIDQWLSGGRASPSAQAPPLVDETPLFVDLTPRELDGRAAVARALIPSRMPLAFGCGHPWLAPDNTSVHPIA